MEFRENVPLAPCTTFEIGGPARWFVDAASDEEMIQAVEFARQKALPLLVLGGGSNLLIADDGFPGLVLHLASTGMEAIPSSDTGLRRFSVAAGENWDAFVSFAVDQGCGGIECLAGIPGTVGGTPMQNVGAYGQEVSTTITKVRALDLDTLRHVELPHDACGFAYRTSIFNTAERGRYIVTSVEFQLAISARPSLGYKDLASYFQAATHPPTLAEVSAAVREIRHAKGMLLVPGESDCRSAGSFFKNPILSDGQFDELRAKIGAFNIPMFPAGPGFVKVPAAWLLEQAGFQKGFSLDSSGSRAGISSRHTLALVNRGGATARDILALRDRITAGVLASFNIELEAEPVMIGIAVNAGLD